VRHVQKDVPYLRCIGGVSAWSRGLPTGITHEPVINSLAGAARATTPSTMEISDEITGASDPLLPIVYAELRRLAASYLRRERPGHTLQPTALVHEAYVRLMDQRQIDWSNRAQFMGLAAVMMRRVLVNHARDRVADKRGGGAEHVPLTLAGEGIGAEEVNLLDLHDALDRLSESDPRKGKIVELKFFGGLTTDEIAEMLNVSTATVERDWKFARAWLYRAVSGE
jgi:RNA polymerase sigma-70 factor, ECF subfamily